MPETPKRNRKPATKKRPHEPLSIRLSPAEHQAINAACEHLRFTKAGLVRHMLEPVFQGYSSETPQSASQFATTLPEQKPVPKPNALRYDPREYMRLWNINQLRQSDQNAVTHFADQIAAAKAGKAEYPSARDTARMLRDRTSSPAKFRE